MSGGRARENTAARLQRAALAGAVAAALVAGTQLPGCGGEKSAPAQGAAGAPGAGGPARGAGGGAGGPGGPGGGKSRMQFPVEAIPVQARDVEYSVFTVGSVEAFEVVQMTARVPGVVDKVSFVEGDFVKPGQVLVEIEPERYQLAVQSAKATLEKAEAAKADADAGLARREGAIAKNPGLIPGEEMETWRTRVRMATAEVSQARAALDQAELNLRYAFVSAPVGGTIQTRSVQTGEYVQASNTLATLVRRDPLLLRFQVPEQDAARLHPGLRAHFTVRESQRAYDAVLSHVAESADKASRMVAVTARVEPRDGDAPRPGAFAEVTVPVGMAANAPVIPQTAVRPSERGFLAYVVESGVARERVLTLGMRTSDGLVEVRGGLRPGELLVVRGAEALRDGAPVRVSAGAAPAAGVAPPAAGEAPAGGTQPAPVIPPAAAQTPAPRGAKP